MLHRMAWTMLRLLRRRLCARVVRGRLITVSLGVVFLFSVWTFGSLPTPSPYVTYLRAKSFVPKPVKKILIWTPFLSDNILHMEEACLATCNAKCEVTTNKVDIAGSDAVNFHLSNLWTKVWRIGTRETIKFPSYRREDQVWILSNLEPPPHLWGDLNVFNNVFNWTMWYRRDATVNWPYGVATELNKTEKIEAVRRESGGRNIYKEKEYEIFGRISNCADPGRRYRIIRELQRYLDVDMYGLCYNRPCGNPRDQWDKSCDRLMRKFKFYIGFENSACTDYITEKYWWALGRDQIPIVNWKNIDKALPIPNSYINIYDFPDLKSFAEYIKKVSANETLYNSYFDWKREYKPEDMCQSCSICHALHDPSMPAQVISNLDGWVQDDVCEKVGVCTLPVKIVYRNLLYTYQ